MSGVSAMGQRYEGVIVRLLDPTERRVPTSEIETPLVIAPRQSSAPQFLEHFLSSHSVQLIEDIAKHGAILLRGFKIDSATEFERQVLSIRSMQGFSDIMLMERGRIRLNGTQHVIHPNALYTIGGKLNFGAFHSENYYLPDVPRYISFFCIKPSSLGGETGLLNTAKLFEDLPIDVRQKLEERSYVVNQTPIATIAERYGISEQDCERFCVSAGLPITSSERTKHMVICKPSVVRHPLTGERSLMIDTNELLDTLWPLLLEIYLPDYGGWRWLIHRLYWTHEWVPRFAGRVRMYRRRLHRRVSLAVRGNFPKRVKADAVLPSAELLLPRVKSAFTVEDLKLVALGMRRRFSSFLWKSGDILIIDNLKMAHAGLPGRGERKLPFLLCNPVVLDYSRDALGIQLLAKDRARSLGEQLIVLRNNVAKTGEIN
jgi:hypothetical protein